MTLFFCDGISASAGNPPLSQACPRTSLTLCDGASASVSNRPLSRLFPFFPSGSVFLSTMPSLTFWHCANSCLSFVAPLGQRCYAYLDRITFSKLSEKFGTFTKLEHDNTCTDVGTLIAAPVGDSVVRSFDCGNDSSWFSRLFPNENFNCYLGLIGWVRPSSLEASVLLANMLPSKGPVVAVDLGLLLSAIVIQYDLKRMTIPTVVERPIMGVKFMHFDEMQVENVRFVIIKLLAFDGFVGAGGIDPMTMVNVASTTGASTIAANQASTLFRNALDTMVRVKTLLSEEEEEWIKRDRKHANFTKEIAVNNDHPYMAACREIVRHDFNNLINLKSTTMRCLILGASSREYREYNTNIHVSFQIANKEAKDIDRSVLECLTQLRNLKMRKVSKNKKNIESMQRSSNDLKNVEEAILEWKQSRKVPDRIVLWKDTEEMLKQGKGFNYDILIFQDVGYNFTAKMWGDLFRATGAVAGFGYMCLPWELLQPYIISPPGYVYRVKGEYSQMAYHGFSTGYSHLTKSWETLMKNVAINCGDFSLAIEFVSRVGPMTCINLVRTTTSETILRHLGVPDYLKTMLILDINICFDRKRGEIDTAKIKYFPVRVKEFDETVNYGLDIAKESLNYNNILLYVRRRTAGLSLLSKTIGKAWTLPSSRIPDFSLVAYIYVTHLIRDYTKFQDAVKETNFAPFSKFVRKATMPIVNTWRDVYDYFCSYDMFEILTQEIPQDFWQEKSTRMSSKQQTIVSTGVDPESLHPDEFSIIEQEEETDFVSCFLCGEIKEACGDQLFTCDRNKEESFYHEFSLTGPELTRLRTCLADTNKDPIGLKETKEEALKHTPLASFSNRVKVQYVCGPPGTGKSYIIRALATKQDLVVGPFSRLKDDYTNFVHTKTGSVTSLRYLTQHKAFSALNHPRIFVDEFTAMPYEFLAVIVNNCSADEVFLVGDIKQTSLINEVEGISITSKIDMQAIRSHGLIKNFRNPVDAVNFLNRVYNYQMIAVNKHMGFKFDHTRNFSNYPDHTPLFFKHSTAELFGMTGDTSEKVTVRANQGATYNRVKLVIVGADSKIFNMPEMSIVAFSRHRIECVILTTEDMATAPLKGMVQANMRIMTNKLPANISPIFTDEEVNLRTENIYADMPRLIDNDEAQSESDEDDGYWTAPDKPSNDSDDDDNNDDDDQGGAGVISLPHGTDNTKDETEDNDSPKTKETCAPPEKPNNDPDNNNDGGTGTSSSSHKDNVNKGKGKELEASAPAEKPSNSNNNNNGEAGTSSSSHKNNVTKNESKEDDPSKNKEGCKNEQKDSFSMLVNVCKLIDQKVSILGKHPMDKTNDQTVPITIKSVNQKEIKTKLLKFGIKDINLKRAPIDNNCLLACLALLTSHPIDSVWLSLVSAIGKTKAIAVYNQPLSTDELRHFCVHNTIRVQVTSEDLSFICGFEGEKIGHISHSRKGVGHFEVTQKFISKEIKLIINQDGNNSKILKDAWENFWEQKFKRFETQTSKLTPAATYQMLRNLQSIINWDAELLNIITTKTNYQTVNIKSLKATAVTTLLTNLQIDDPRIDHILQIVMLTKTKRFVINLLEQLKAQKPKTYKLVGGSEIQVMSLPNVPIVMVKDTPPTPLTNIPESFVHMARLFVNPVYLRKILVDAQTPEKHNIVKLEQSSFNAFKMLAEDFATVDEHDLVIANQETLEYIDPRFGNGSFDMTTLDNLNQRGHPKRMSESGWCLLNVAPGVTYYKSNLMQSLHCLQARYLTKQYATAFTHEGVEKAREIADLFFNEHMEENFDIFNEQDIATTVHESEHAMKIKNYDKQTNFELIADHDVRFTMKDIFKPTKTKIDMFKAGQGISAWSKDMQTIFQTSFRLINKHFINSLKPHVVYDNGIDDFTLMVRINALFQMLPITAINGVIDATACDSGQNRFTQMIERRILERLGIDDSFLDWYYMHRQEYILKGYGVVAHVKDIKTSGEPATLLNNTILMACLMNYLLRGEGPSVIVIKGDDGLKRQANMQHLTSFGLSLRKHLKMEFKVDIDVPLTFCGYFLSGSNLIPDIVRKCFKILGHRFRNYEHFSEYQQSLRDWVLVVNKLGLFAVCEVTATSYDITFDYCYSLFHSIVSLTHIGEKQFRRFFHYREINLKEYFQTTTPWTEKVPWYHGDN